MRYRTKVRPTMGQFCRIVGATLVAYICCLCRTVGATLVAYICYLCRAKARPTIRLKLRRYFNNIIHRKHTNTA
jgi:hypothetical protein